MRKTILILCLLLMALTAPPSARAAEQENAVPLDAAHFPDAAFRAHLAGLYDRDGDGALSGEEREIVSSLFVQEKGIRSLEGIGYFPALESLLCWGNALTRLDLRGNPALREVYCGGNLLDSLDVSGCPMLEDLSCYENRLTLLDLSGNPALRYLTCGGNALTCLDISCCPKLTMLEAEGMEAALDAPGGLAELTALPGFDPARASGWQGAEVSGSVLKAEKSCEARYVYDCGSGFRMAVTLQVRVTEQDPRDIPGNVTGDPEGIVDGRDALRLVKFLAGQNVDINRRAADLNGDGKIDGRDALRLTKMLAGIDGNGE